jgi:flagellar basal-body rod modification protein FlgD
VSNPNASLSLQDFLQVLMTQLTYQDPLKPMDNQQFMAQIAQFTTLEQTQQLNSNIQTLVANQAAQQSVGMIGRTVNITTANGPISGKVASIDLSGATPLLTLTSSAGTLTGISFSQITSVQ